VGVVGDDKTVAQEQCPTPLGPVADEDLLPWLEVGQGHHLEVFEVGALPNTALVGRQPGVVVEPVQAGGEESAAFPLCEHRREVHRVPLPGQHDAACPQEGVFGEPRRPRAALRGEAGAGPEQHTEEEAPSPQALVAVPSGRPRAPAPVQGPQLLLGPDSQETNLLRHLAHARGEARAAGLHGAPLRRGELPRLLGSCGAWPEGAGDEERQSQDVAIGQHCECLLR